MSGSILLDLLALLIFIPGVAFADYGTVVHMENLTKICGVPDELVRQHRSERLFRFRVVPLSAAALMFLLGMPFNGWVQAFLFGLAAILVISYCVVVGVTFNRLRRNGAPSQ